MEQTTLVRALVIGLGVSLSGCPTVDTGETPVAPGSCLPSRAYFEDVLWTEYIAPDDPAASCIGGSGCHRSSDGFSGMRFDATDPIDFDLNYRVATRFVRCGSFDTSPLLTKPLVGIDTHGGPEFIELGSPQEIAFSTWFDAP